MRIFIVHAHPEPNSFNGALTSASQEALSAAGHQVVVSDLYAMGFNPVSDRSNFTTVRDANYYRQQAEEANAAAHDGFAPDIQAEMDKLFWCDALILQLLLTSALRIATAGLESTVAAPDKCILPTHTLNRRLAAMAAQPRRDSKGHCLFGMLV
ncbi:NAD(P)H-dependent oxidoreductase [Mesorhizobium amorphae]|uniref:Ribosyldihydronicotinamide dehydrogenase (Quinone) n=1 Tax=Mesorhizobium amorphae CCNWGS0123 TaxID=1082933 RepID=G6YH23_9HYPH|nr:NAD(P)H-dependent oxidoreductase [Mesorhizobium amorphae]ANT50159.1 hypothetical protein A6B35_09570 [Mesorhizobium amorphae CCNWGS0123]EHH08352.1 ribosyldihydronicotinamide dehydrogenase (quinone) [Mesorhizobium amorphae CCNWGS0123]GLR39651.1 hypothetical protein GCM10007880_01670 [Mesorhizobium amorphae]